MAKKPIPKSAAARAKETWRTKDGKEILICEMDDNHLINTLRMLKRNACNLVVSGHVEDWRDLLPGRGSKRAWYMEEECAFRGICWDPEECHSEVRAASEETCTDVCSTCPLSMMCLAENLTSVRCYVCKRVYVPRGGGVGNISVPDNCPRLVISAAACCSKCSGKGSMGWTKYTTSGHIDGMDY